MRQIREMHEARPPRIYDSCRPNNPNIPFFASSREYENRILPELPELPELPDRDRVWLVEPGLCSIEVYEASLKKSHRRCPPLTKYICRSGVVQVALRTHPYAPTSAAEDRHLREERDICFTLLSGKEGLYIIQRLHSRGALSFPSHKLATPLGLTTTILWVQDERAQDERARHNIYRELGLGTDDSEFPRSALPHGVIPIRETDSKEWELPGAGGIARDGRATDDCGIHRIEWPPQRDA
ncbi:hypothetical protein ISF_08540 [Cordyceps fumosorosea ARSEF 2679]|uniref:Uncharacterized protein n=1 Tax=Cordyceps fumosorosea (strain ARSEF 2679) TaxID=1081104 RepID=A0A162MC15_CORFA|nr:hypothetical protein ISF_08540 [Cordyceps fumosorosea ARSEF 2679]OAA54060.1 hypothetical protein ISF_08540 [Cordyceps fumosorosea ARSEF 2679]